MLGRRVQMGHFPGYLPSLGLKRMHGLLHDPTLVITVPACNALRGLWASRGLLPSLAFSSPHLPRQPPGLTWRDGQVHAEEQRVI